MKAIILMLVLITILMVSDLRIEVQKLRNEHNLIMDRMETHANK